MLFNMLSASRFILTLIALCCMVLPLSHAEDGDPKTPADASSGETPEQDASTAEDAAEVAHAPATDGTQRPLH